ncbi:hypothetical protein [Mycolicibacterium vinylchloridicum]|uniref:hypothetical protein n=1 Tax=Mycolicibacterium vinylchloridicum TaxID=2736928 RepID=UPI001F3880B7|nr:hypothetical protein [Mycolicibacterium vinylchloridicum]
MDAIAESLSQSYGQYRTIVVNKGTLTGRPNEVLAGDHTLMAASQARLGAPNAHPAPLCRTLSPTPAVHNWGMRQLYTKKGRPLQVFGTDLHSKNGKYIGQIKGDKVFAKNGRYIGTIVGDRVAYRGTDKHHFDNTATPAKAARPGVALAHITAVAMYGDEPDFPD